jgi:hypothetical protein
MSSVLLDFATKCARAYFISKWPRDTKAKHLLRAGRRAAPSRCRKNEEDKKKKGAHTHKHIRAHINKQWQDPARRQVRFERVAKTPSEKEVQLIAHALANALKNLRS